MQQFEINIKIRGHQLSVQKIIKNPFKQNQIISIGLDNNLLIWKLPSLQLINKINIKMPYLTSLLPFENQNEKGFLIGTGNGYLIRINQEYKIIKNQKIHKGSISQIIQTEQYIITISHDGKIFFLNNQTFRIIKCLQLQNPLLSCVQYQGYLYIASQKSFIVNIHTFQYKKTLRYESFCVANNKIFGCSHDKGLTCLNTGSNTYVPSEYMIPYKRNIILFSQKSICLVNHLDKMAWKSQMFDIFSKGESIKSAIIVDRYIYVGGNQGNIYMIKIEQCQNNTITNS